MKFQLKISRLLNILKLRFENGLTVLTGETGAGKSIIIDAVQLIGRWKRIASVSFDMVRKGQNLKGFYHRKSKTSSFRYIKRIWN